MRRALLIALIAATFAGGCAANRPYRVADPTSRAETPRIETGMASFYGKKFDGRRTASGETFTIQGMTAAHPTLPFGTKVRVTNLYNGNKVVLRVTDRGPFRKGRIIDVSHRAAMLLGMVRLGVVKVRVEVMGQIANAE
jgi:rare lipoprotein A